MRETCTRITRPSFDLLPVRQREVGYGKAKIDKVVRRRQRRDLSCDGLIWGSASIRETTPHLQNMYVVHRLLNLVL